MIEIERKFLLISEAFKTESSKSGLSRFEWEKEITKVEAQELLKLYESGFID